MLGEVHAHTRQVLGNSIGRSAVLCCKTVIT